MSDEHARPEQAPAYILCDIGFRVFANRLVDSQRGCGHKTCYPLSCEYLKRLKREEQND